MSLITTEEQLRLNQIFDQLVQMLGFRSEVLSSMKFGDLMASIVDPSGEVTLTGTQNLSNKTFTDALRSSAVTNQLALGTTHVVTISAVAPAASQTLTIPDTAGADTFAFLAATQELTHKTLTAPVMKNGLTASGSAAYDLTGSTGDFKLPTGALSWNGDNTKGASLKSGTAMTGSASAFSLDLVNSLTAGDSILSLLNNGVAFLNLGKAANFAYPCLYTPQTALGLFCDPGNAFGATGFSLQDGALYVFVSGNGTNKYTFNPSSFTAQSTYSLGLAAQPWGTVWGTKANISTAVAFPPWWSVVSNAASGNITISDGGANYTIGAEIRFTQVGSCTGAKIYWLGGVGAQTVTVDLWTGGVSVASGTVAVNAAGVYTVTFTSAYTVDITKLSTKFYLTYWAGGAAHYPYITQANWNSGNGPSPFGFITNVQAAPHYLVVHPYVYNAATGHSVPDSPIDTDLATIEPTFTV